MEGDCEVKEIRAREKIEATVKIKFNSQEQCKNALADFKGFIDSNTYNVTDELMQGIVDIFE